MATPFESADEIRRHLQSNRYQGANRGSLTVARTLPVLLDKLDRIANSLEREAAARGRSAGKPTGQEEFDVLVCMDCGDEVPGHVAKPGPTCRDCFSDRFRATPNTEESDGR